MIGAVARRPVAVAVQPVVAWQEPVEGRQEVVVRAGPDLDDDEPGRRVRDEEREQAVAAIGRVGDERRAFPGQVGQAPTGAGPDGDLAGVYGKMLRIASRRRPRPPIAGADS